MNGVRPHVLVCCGILIATLTGVLGALRADVIDLRSAWLSRSATGNIVVIAIDAPSIYKIGVWPWPRNLHAQLLGKLEEAGVREVAFDVDFSSRSSAAADEVFAEALRHSGGSVILPTFKQVLRRDKSDHLYINEPIGALRDASWMALVNVRADEDGVVRRYGYGDAIGKEFVPSMAALLAGSSKASSQEFYLDFSIRSDTIPIVSYIDVLEGKSKTLEKLRDKRVLIGATAVELGDRFTIPRGEIISGPILQALAVESILQGRELGRTSEFFGALLAVLVGLIMLLLWHRSLATRINILLMIGVAAEVIAVLVQSWYPLIIDTTLMLLTLALYIGICAFEELDVRRLLSQIADRRFNHITMALGDGVVCTDANGNVTVWNARAVSIFGRSLAEVLGKPITYLHYENGSEFRIEKFPRELLARGGAVIEVVAQRADGTRLPAEACLSAWETTRGLQYGMVIRDISARKREAERVRRLAEYDTLTNLANRYTFNNRFEEALASAADQNFGVGILLIDLDTFKEVNDTLGHGAGDQVLFETASVLNSLENNTELVARIGGDEFAVLVSGPVGEIREIFGRVAAEILEKLSALRLEISGRQIVVQASIGAAIHPLHGNDAQELLSNSDLALYRAKAEGRNRYVCFDPGFRQALEKRLSLEGELKSALGNNEFELFYQPKVDLKTNVVVGAEALIRWRHPARGLVPPAEFIAVVNSSAISTPVALWVLSTAIKQARQWQLQSVPVRVSVNLSPSLIHSGQLFSSVCSLLHETGLSPSLLQLEVTEDIVLVDERRALQTFKDIQDIGVQIAFDDFGTGYASLSYLKKFPLDVLKIDRSFVVELKQKRDDVAIVAATIGLGKQFNLSVIAEGIEDAETAAMLLEMGCDEGQGYHFGRPMTASDFERQFLTAPKSTGDCDVVAA